MNRNRKPSESVSKYALALRELCGDYDYSAGIQSEMLRDVFVKVLNLPSVQTKLMMKDNTLTFDNAYKEAVAKDLAAKCSIEFNASSSWEGGTVLPVLTRLKVSTGCRHWVGRNTMPTKVQFPVVMRSTARSPATAVVEITVDKNANSPMKGVTGVTRSDTLLGCAEQYRNLCSTVWHMWVMVTSRTMTRRWNCMLFTRPTLI